MSRIENYREGIPLSVREGFAKTPSEAVLSIPFEGCIDASIIVAASIRTLEKPRARMATTF
jgi:hypothetical protein